jgi:hypothetical protein
MKDDISDSLSMDHSHHQWLPLQHPVLLHPVRVSVEVSGAGDDRLMALLVERAVDLVEEVVESFEWRLIWGFGGLLNRLERYLAEVCDGVA